MEQLGTYEGTSPAVVPQRTKMDPSHTLFSNSVAALFRSSREAEAYLSLLCMLFCYVGLQTNRWSPSLVLFFFCLIQAGETSQSAGGGTKRQMSGGLALQGDFLKPTAGETQGCASTATLTTPSVLNVRFSFVCPMSSRCGVGDQQQLDFRVFILLFFGSQFRFVCLQFRLEGKEPVATAHCGLARHVPLLFSFLSGAPAPCS